MHVGQKFTLCETSEDIKACLAMGNVSSTELKSKLAFSWQKWDTNKAQMRVDGEENW